MNKIDIHADDYGETVHTSEDILECILRGKLDSISIVPNMHCYDDCERMLLENIPNMSCLPLISVHINLVEGFYLSRDIAGGAWTTEFIECSWGELFMASYMPWKYSSYKSRLKFEIKEQISRVKETFDKCVQCAKEHNVVVNQKSLRIDSHQHTHMIPVVWNALMEVIDENNWDVEYIRNSKEPIGVFIREKSLWKTYSPINFIKNFILNFYSYRVDRYYAQNKMQKMYLWGLVMSGYMDRNRVSVLDMPMRKKAQEQNRILEILFHPGSILETEIEQTPELSAHALPFYRSEGRFVEKEAVLWYEK